MGTVNSVVSKKSEKEDWIHFGWNINGTNKINEDYAIKHAKTPKEHVAKANAAS